MVAIELRCLEKLKWRKEGPSGHMYIKITIQFLSKIYLLTHVYFIQKYRIENTFRITFQIPLLSIGIRYKLQHDGLHAEHATIFKATLRSFSAERLKIIQVVTGQICHVSVLQ